MTKPYKSEALAAAHEAALGLAEAGVMSKQTMRAFDEMCLIPVKEMAPGKFRALADFVQEECDRRLRAYAAQPRDAVEHFETENEVLSGGYAYRQLYELIQNAADAVTVAGDAKGRIYVRLTPDTLLAANSGEALDEDGIVALLNARSSAKRGNQIGRFGIGFKSLLKLGGPIDLVSRTIGLRFDPDVCRQRIRNHLDLPPDARAPGMRLAEVLDPHAPDSLLSSTLGYSWATTVVSARITNESVFERIAKEMETFPSEFLLFLPADIELDLEVEGDGSRHISKRIEGDVSIVSDGSTETRWRLFETRVNVESSEARADATHTQVREDMPLAWAVPLGGREPAGRFWAFFPTETHSLTSGILNAPWKLNSDRTNLIRGPWNEAIMESASELITGSLPELATPEDYGAPVSAFPRQPDRLDEIAVPLVNSLWGHILDARVLPATDGNVRKPDELRRHLTEDTEICGQWAALAPPEARAVYIHPDCYRLRNRISRLNALAAEAKRRGITVLQQVSVKGWLEALADTDVDHAKRVLSFVGNLLDEKYKHKIYGVPEVRLIPAADGTLVVPSKAVITNGPQAPAGFVAVAVEFALDPKCKEILVDKFEINELSDESWEELLEASLDAAEDEQGPQAWDNLWRNLSVAPDSAIDLFLSQLEADRLKYRTLSGSWAERHSLVATGPDSGISDELVIDLDYIRELGLKLPHEWLTEFPSDDETAGDELKPYLRWTSPAFDAVCRERVGSTPRYLPRIQGYRFRLPAGWRLLSVLPPGPASRLTKVMVQRALEGERRFRPVTLVHPTREGSYPKISAPHPCWFHMTEHGRVHVGGRSVRLREVQPELARVLANTGLSELHSITAFFAARDEETELGPQLNWPSTILSEKHSRKFWKAVFEKIQTLDTGFAGLRKLWHAAHTSGAIPSKVPTADGPLPLSEIYVTTDADVDAGPQLDDGRVVLLSPQCASSWVEAGAHALTGETAVSFRVRLSEPAHLLDLFPEFAVSDALAEKLNDLLAVWVEGLEEHLGPHKRETTVAMDAGRAIILDRPRFRGGGRSDGIALLLRCLERYRLLPSEQDFDSLLASILDRHTEDARSRVRARSSLTERLLEAVGNDPDALLSILTPATRQALTDEIEPSEAAELALAVHGPAVLSQLRDALEAQGLAPPKRWGGQPARTFVLDLGFPLEFASTVGGRREAEISISGPIKLPPLHNYQEEILNDIRRLVSSGVGRRRAVVSLPTGGGKTRVVAEAVVRLVLRGDDRRSVLWVAQTDELCEQAVQCFRQLWVNVGESGEDLRIVRLWGGQRNPSPSEGDEAVVVVASIQTLNSRSGRAELGWVAEAGIIVIDECHHAIASSYTELLRWLDIQVGSERSREREAPVLGLSATPWRGYNDEESERLAARFDRRWFPADQAELHQTLSAMGVLADRSYRPLRYDRRVELTPREQQHVETFGELPDSVIDRIGEDADRNRLVVRAVLRSSASSILLFANSVAHAQYLAARLHLEGCPAAAVSGQTSRLARQHFTRKFRSGELRVICNHSVLTTGFDAPKSDLILISRPVLSPVLYMQMVGRGLRGPKNGGTPHCEIVTVEDNIVNFRDRLAYQFCRRYFGI